MKILVTGGCGFIGSHVAEHFAGRGWEVHVADRVNYAGKVRNLEFLSGEVRLWVGDLSDREFCERLGASHFDAIVHLASNTHVDRSIVDPVRFSIDNVVATNQLLHAVENAPPAKIVVYSTDEVFGPTPYGMAFSETQPYNPSNAYSASKVGIEALARAYFITHRMPLVVVRPSNTYGRRQHPEKAIPRWTRQALAGEPLTLHGDGSGARDWLHTSDHARAIECLVERGVPGESYNLGASDEHSDAEVARAVCGVLGLSPRLRHIMQRPGHDRRYLMDTRKLRNLGWEPQMRFLDGLTDEINWAKENPEFWWRDDISVASGRKLFEHIQERPPKVDVVAEVKDVQ